MTVTLDGNQWCALIGYDLMTGVAGFGDTPEEAIADLLENLLNEGVYECTRRG